MEKIGLICDRIRWDEKALVRAATKSKIEIKIIDPKTTYIDPLSEDKNLKREFGEVIIQRCVSYFRGLHITAILENVGIKVINSFKVSQICGNKLFTTLALKNAGIPVPRTLVAFTQQGAIKALEKLSYPAVIKPVVGSWGRLIALIKDNSSAQAIIESREQMRNSLLQIYYIQEYVKRPPRDIRVLVIGEEAIAASYRYSPENDWRTNVARGGKSEYCPITDELEDIVLKTAEKVGGGVLAIDCMESPSGILANEVNSTVEFRGLSSATKIDIPKKIIDYVVKVSKR
jgi:[lysine-biosynthesis-protein LysW]--L-2-aminoadipate ligase